MSSPRLCVAFSGYCHIYMLETQLALFHNETIYEKMIPRGAWKSGHLDRCGQVPKEALLTGLLALSQAASCRLREPGERIHTKPHE